MWNRHVPGLGSRPADPGDKRGVATQPARPLRVDFSEEELNASFQKWDQLYGWTERYRNYVQDPSVVIHDGRLVLATEEGVQEPVGAGDIVHLRPA